MKIISWNVNSIKVRLNRLLDVIDRHNPDVICLQELKCENDKFPFDAIKSKGYNAEVFGQKMYNGVAILAKSPIELIDKGNPFFKEDPQSRLISAEIDGYSIVNLYCPNGANLESEKYTYKLEWFEKLSTYIENTFSPEESLVLCGDFNIAPKREDTYDPERLEGNILCSPKERLALKNLLDFGLADLFHLFNKKEAQYTWWDYRGMAFNQNKGFRIDYFLVTEPLMDECIGYEVDFKEREEKLDDKPSDHAPIVLNLREL